MLGHMCSSSRGLARASENSSSGYIPAVPGETVVLYGWGLFGGRDLTGWLLAGL